MLMSALAEGADRLAAEVALDAGIGLIVPLPMQQELYEQDFDEESRRQFRQVLERAEFSYELPLEPGNTVESVQQEGAARDRQYQALGRELVQTCQILIAIWDGLPNGPVGGTSDLVRMQLEGDEPLAGDNLFLPPQVGPVIHLHARRHASGALETSEPVGCNSGDNSSAGVSYLFPVSTDTDECQNEAHQRVLTCIDRFNSDAAALARLPSFAICKEQAAGYVIPQVQQPPDGTLTRNELPGDVQTLLGCFAHADAMAQQFQKGTYQAFSCWHAWCRLSFSSLRSIQM